MLPKTSRNGTGMPSNFQIKKRSAKPQTGSARSARPSSRSVKATPSAIRWDIGFDWSRRTDGRIAGPLGFAAF